MTIIDLVYWFHKHAFGIAIQKKISISISGRAKACDRWCYPDKYFFIAATKTSRQLFIFYIFHRVINDCILMLSFLSQSNLYIIDGRHLMASDKMQNISIIILCHLEWSPNYLNLSCTLWIARIVLYCKRSANPCRKLFVLFLVICLQCLNCFITNWCTYLCKECAYTQNWYIVHS